MPNYVWRLDVNLPTFIQLINLLNFAIMNKYNRMKAAARSAAIEWQAASNDAAVSYSELAEIGERFYKLGKRYGLLMEFRENGIPC